MMVKNQSFHKNVLMESSSHNQKKQMNDFYNTIFKQISSTNFAQLKLNQQQCAARLSESKKPSAAQPKTTRVSGKITRLSKGGNGGSGTGTACVNSNSKS